MAFSHYFWLLRRNWRWIALFVTLVTASVAVYCYKVQPIYEGVSRITIDQKTPSMAIGQEPTVGGDVDQSMLTEVQIIQSDAVLRPVVEQFHLNQPVKTAKSNASGSSDSAAGLSDAPVVLPNLSVSRLPNSLLIDIRYRSTDRKQAADVANAIAMSYIAHGMEMRARSSMGLSNFMEKQIAELKGNMNRSSLALAGYERQLGVIDPEQKTSILSARLIQLNSQYTEAENDRIRKETEFRELQSNAPADSGATLSGAALEVSPQAAALGRQQELLHAAQEKLAVAKTVYGPNYSEYKRAANDVAELTTQYEQMRSDISKRIEVEYREAVNRANMLHTSLQQAKDESDQLNANSSKYQELKRETEADTKLYDELFHKIKEAGINASFEGTSIRIADEARPGAFPVFPKKSLFISLAFLLSFMASVLAVVLIDIFDKTLRDPDQALRLTGMKVVGLLPYVRRFSNVYKPSTLADEAADMAQIAVSKRDWIATESFFRESISTLLSTVLFNRSGSRPRSLLVTSASQGDGKSSCAAHLALAHAGQGRRTLLIDADLRSSFQHDFFNLKNDSGMHDAICKSSKLSDIRQTIEGAPSLDVVVAGPWNRHNVSRVGMQVAELLRQAPAEGYDLVIVDAPPLIGLAEPVEISCLTDGVLVIGDAGRTSQQEIMGVLTTLDRVHAKVIGLVLNRFRMSMSQSYKRYGSYSAYARRLAA